MNDHDGTERDPAQAMLCLLAEGLPATAPPATLRDRLLSSLCGTARYLPFASDVARHYGLTDVEARAVLARASDPNAWLAGATPGSSLLVAPELDRVQAVIARLPAGAHIPVHVHDSCELTFVLDGILHDDTRTLQAGELMTMQPGSQHAVRVDPLTACVVVLGNTNDPLNERRD